ncbi:MAG: glycosyltransferase family 2 protein [Desulfarculus sp.]|nr:glycosyltransferase family 2 protein [Desulfarculus sp.]
MYHGQSVSLVLPTYNEKDSIREVINNFAALGALDEIIVVNNNAKEGTSQEVAGTAAREVLESDQGYGAAIMRGLREAKGDLVAVCEPDGTFLERDIFKLLEYSRDFDVVYGSRTMNDLIWEGANMGWFLRFGNWSVAKLMEVLYGSCSLSDVGCTYRLLNRQARDLVLATCRIKANYFGPEMMMATIRAGLKNVQIPLNYKERVGVSSVTGNHFVAFKLGLRMIWLILGKRFTRFPPPDCPLPAGRI